MSDSQPQPLRSLDEQRAEFARRRGLAMPLAGLIVWTLIGAAGAFLPPILAVWSLFIGAGFIAYLGMMLSRLTGENFLDKKKPKNAFDSLFFHCVAMALFVYAIAIPFFRVDYTSLPLTVGILAGLMWIPFSWIIQHWVGIFHTVRARFWSRPRGTSHRMVASSSFRRSSSVCMSSQSFILERRWHAITL